MNKKNLLPRMAEVISQITRKEYINTAQKGKSISENIAVPLEITRYYKRATKLDVRDKLDCPTARDFYFACIEKGLEHEEAENFLANVDWSARADWLEKEPKCKRTIIKEINAALTLEELCIQYEVQPFKSVTFQVLVKGFELLTGVKIPIKGAKVSTKTKPKKRMQATS